MNLFYLLEIIRGSKYPEKEQQIEAEEGREGISKHAIINEEGELIIRKNGQRRIMQHFKSFFINRLQFEGFNKRPVKTIELDLDAKPTISDKSKKIAYESRSKYVG